MATKRRKKRVSPSFGPQKVEAALRRSLVARDVLRRAKRHQTFPWLVATLEQWLEGETQGVSLETVSARTRIRLRKMSLEVLQALYSLKTQENLIAAPKRLGPCIRGLITEDQIAAQFMVVLKQECTAYLLKTRHAELTDLPPVIEEKPKRKPNRNRVDLPDPDQPAWAGVNRRPSSKVQMTLRFDPHIKDMIVAASKEFGMSQAAWIEMLVFSQLRHQGHDTRPARTKGQHSHASAKARRTRRAALPEPEMSPNASVNRADKATSMRMSKSLVAAIDHVRAGKLDRSQWLNVAVREYLASKERLPEADTNKEALTELYAVHFDRDFFLKLEKSIKKSGLTNSEWFRRVARWSLQNHS